jgi:hypothetical protein
MVEKVLINCFKQYHYEYDEPYEQLFATLMSRYNGELKMKRKRQPVQIVSEEIGNDEYDYSENEEEEAPYNPNILEAHLIKNLERSQYNLTNKLRQEIAKHCLIGEKVILQSRFKLSDWNNHFTLMVGFDRPPTRITKKYKYILYKEGEKIWKQKLTKKDRMEVCEDVRVTLTRFHKRKWEDYFDLCDSECYHTILSINDGYLSLSLTDPQVKIIDEPTRWFVLTKDVFKPIMSQISL